VPLEKTKNTLARSRYRAMTKTLIFCFLLLPLWATFAGESDADSEDPLNHASQDNSPGYLEDREKSSQGLDCNDPVNSARATIKETVGPLYAKGADLPQLKTTANQIDRFITDATYCRVALQSGPRKVSSAIIGEWSSLQQWLNRLANTFHLSASEAGHVGWRDEYTLFAEIYEFEP